MSNTNLTTSRVHLMHHILTYLDTDVYKCNRFCSNGVLDMISDSKTAETYRYLPINNVRPENILKIITGCETIRHIGNNNDILKLNKHSTILVEKWFTGGIKIIEINKITQNKKKQTEHCEEYTIKTKITKLVNMTRVWKNLKKLN